MRQTCEPFRWLIHVYVLLSTPDHEAIIEEDSAASFPYISLLNFHVVDVNLKRYKHMRKSCFQVPDVGTGLPNGNKPSTFLDCVHLEKL